MNMETEDSVPLPVLLEHLNWHLQRMLEMEGNERTVYFRDAALQRFEFTLTAVLKCLRAAARHEGRDIETDEAVLEWAFREGGFPPDTQWDELLTACREIQPEDREQSADRVYAHLADYRRRLQHLYEFLIRRFNDR